MGLSYPNNGPGLYIAPNKNNLVVIMNTFNVINEELMPIRAKYNELVKDKDYINDVLRDGSNKARVIAKEKINEIREVIGITNIS